MQKSKYKGSLYKGSLYKGNSRNCRWEGRFIIVNLVQKSKYRFVLIVGPIANKYYKDTFYFLFFLSQILRLPFLALHIYLIILHLIIFEIISLGCSYLEFLTLIKSLIILQARPEV